MKSNQFIRVASLMLPMLLLTLWSVGQTITVQGTVTDETGETLPGVAVVVKGTTQGISTGMDGQYTLIDVDPSSIITFSLLGYLPEEIPVNGRTSIDVAMISDIQHLEEIVVVGYGTMRRSDLTGSVVRADLETLENSPNVNVLQGLKGIVPGLNIGVATKAGDNPSISIRGRNSISGTTSPLIVLDGIIYRGELTDINPNDIESIDVLKDASSAAIYGAQGANGVLLITTKTSRGLSKPIIEYNTQLTTQSLINDDMQRLDREGFLNQLADIYLSDSRMGDDMLERNPDFNPALLFRDGSVSEGYAKGTDADWWGLLSNPNPYIQNHSISLRGRNELTSYYLSYGFTDQKNMVINDTYKRNSLRINLESIVTDWLKVGTQSFYNSSDFSGRNPSFAALCFIPALVNPYNEDGSLREQIYLGQTNPLLQVDNPDLSVRNTLTGNFFSEISIPWVKGLSYRTNYSNRFLTYKRYEFDPYSNSGQGSTRKSISNQNEWTLDNIVTYRNDFGLHSVNATFVYGVEERNYERTRAGASNFTDMTLGYNNIGVGQADLNTVSSDAWKENSLYTMGRLVYTYFDRYIITGTVRRDGFSGFGENYKFGIFPSAAVAWRVGQENFISDNAPWIDELKIRFSYGTGGNRTIERYSTMAQIAATRGDNENNQGGYVYGEGGTGERTQAIRTLANNDLKWETTTSTNTGIDFSLFNDRIYGNYDFYISNTTDLLYNINIPRVVGTFETSIPTNIGELRNVGHEISITGNPVSTQDFEWVVTGIFSTNRNEVVSILGLDLDGDGKEDDLIASNIFIGEPLDPVYDYNIIGMWQIDDYNAGIIPRGFTYGTYMVEDMDGDDRITADNDRKILGYEDPLYRFSIQNTFRYKGFELRALIHSIQSGKNHYLGQPAEELLIPDHLTNFSYFEFDYWTPENPDSRYRQLGSYTQSLGAGFSPYISRSFIRLQELSIGYNFSAELLNSINIRRAKIYVTATNLFTITDWDGWDPEANQGLTYSLDGGYPTMKGFTFGLNLEF